MISFEEFNKTISRSFWNHIKKNSYVSWLDFPRSKKAHLKKLYDTVIDGTYTPTPPRDYVISNKHNAVARIVPSLTLNDYCVYYFCIARLEDYLAKNRVKGTYGGYRLGGEIRRQENKEFGELEEIPFSVSPFSYNPLAWITAWREFQKKARVYSSKEKFTHFLKFDIANFYNAINLTILERKIRLCCPKELSEIIDLLMFFLKYWNKKFLQYAEQTISIPQDEVGDCSRLLANFYLQDYDEYISDLCDKKDCQYLRYADDQIIMSSNKKIAEEILFDASKELFKIGLNINSSKVDRLNRSEWEYYWCFKIFDLLVDKENIKKIEKAIIELSKLDKNKCRYTSVISRVINCKLETISFDLRYKLLSEIMNDDYLLNTNHRTIMRIYGFLDEGSREQYLSKLKSLSQSTIFNSFHYNLLLAKSNGLPINFDGQLHKRIEELKL